MVSGASGGAPRRWRMAWPTTRSLAPSAKNAMINAARPSVDTRLPASRGRVASTLDAQRLDSAVVARRICGDRAAAARRSPSRTVGSVTAVWRQHANPRRARCGSRRWPQAQLAPSSPGANTSPPAGASTPTSPTRSPPKRRRHLRRSGRIVRIVRRAESARRSVLCHR